jgi:D-alanyl-D-alanine carboxypeptidase (penicillin-binding protein 5/6)
MAWNYMLRFSLAPPPKVHSLTRMHCLRRLSVLLLISAAIAPAGFAAKAKPVEQIYKGAIIMDAASGRVLFEDNADVVNPPASVTKLMTFLIVQERIQAGTLSLQTPVTISAADSKIGGTQVWLKEGEVFPVEELLYALMIQSANDAAYALARTTAGTVPAFVELMNAKAKELGLTRTTFRTPHGLPPASRRISEGDLTSPRDLALLSRHLLLRTEILKYTSIKVRPFRDGQPVGRIDMRNHNHLLGAVAGVDGLKTGFTAGAGFCLAATAQRNNRRIIAVIMGSTDRKTRDIKMAELIEKGFASPSLGAAPPAASLPSAASPVAHAPLSPVEKAPPTGTTDTPAIKFSIPKK